MDFLFIDRNSYLAMEALLFMKTRQLWIEKGYEHFGLYGPEVLNIKKIAKDLSIARTSFNYHFKSKDEFIDDLLSHHRELHSQFIEAGKMHCKKYVPDLHQLLLAFPVGLRFHKQLFNHSHISKYQEVFNKVREITAKEFLIRLFIDYYKQCSCYSCYCRDTYAITYGDNDDTLFWQK